ncbi:hypothetical protein CS542_04535 [Pedobacter sp. IW39]|nr:hypothetical protein CS542_04535 [Pedobacter sp. IW39]
MNKRWKQRQIKLNYSEFKIACKINNLKPEELLQYFISYVFYAFIGGNMKLCTCGQPMRVLILKKYMADNHNQ